MLSQARNQPGTASELNRLERKLRSELHLPWAVCLRGHFAKASVPNTAVGIREPWCVREVKELRPQLQLHVLANREVLNER